MTFDPHREDYQRMGLRFARSLDGQSPSAAARSFSSFGRRFVQNRDSLPQCDEDRAFHLVVSAATLIDYELPFADDDHAESIIQKAHTILSEALKLDPMNPDALRMEQASTIPSFEGYYDYLLEGRAQIKESCERRRAGAQKANGGERAELAQQLAMSPYLRWLHALASKAVVCGHNHAALEFCDELLRLDPTDRADARFTAAIAYAKLEDEEGLLALRGRIACLDVARPREPKDAWLQLALCALAYKRYDLSGAASIVEDLCESYPHAALTLVMQKELPDGVFARLSVPALSEDELILAVSEATVLLQEGRDSAARGSFGAWISREAEKRLTERERRMLELDMAETPSGNSAGNGPAGGNKS